MLQKDERIDLRNVLGRKEIILKQKASFDGAINGQKY